MASLDESIAENVAAARKFFDDRAHPQLAKHYAALMQPALLSSVRASAATRIAGEYEFVAQRTYNGQERDQALAQVSTWNLIADRLRATH